MKVSCRGDYKQERKNKYPSIEEYLDAQVKLNSRDLFIKQEGRKQLQSYVEICLQIKKDYPKPEKE